MKSFVALIFAVALVEFASALTKEYHEKAVAAKDKCAKEHNIDESVVQAFLKKKKLPETEEGKCMIACYMEEMKMIVDGKVNAEEWKSANKHKWEDAAVVAKVDGIVDKCASEVTPDGKNKCEFAVQLTSCGLKAAFEMGIPEPNIENPTRR